MSKSAGQRRRPVDRDRRARRRRPALVPVHRRRGPATPRRFSPQLVAGVAAPLPAHALEHLQLLRHLRQHRRLRPDQHGAGGRALGARPLGALRAERARPEGDRRTSRSTTRRRPAAPSRTSSTTSRTGTSAAAAAASGRASSTTTSWPPTTRSTPAWSPSRSCSRRSRRSSPRRSTRTSSAPSTRTHRRASTSPTGRRPTQSLIDQSADGRDAHWSCASPASAAPPAARRGIKVRQPLASATAFVSTSAACRRSEPSRRPGEGRAQRGATSTRSSSASFSRSRIHVPDDLLKQLPARAHALAEDSGYAVGLDTRITPELADEGPRP